MSRIIVSRAKFTNGLVSGEVLSTETIEVSSVSQAVSAAAGSEEVWSITIEDPVSIWAMFGDDPVAEADQGRLLTGPGTFNFAAKAGEKVAFLQENAVPLERYAEASNVVEPSVSGTPRVGQTLTGDPGEWKGNPAPVVTYGWLVGDEVVSEGATTLVLTEDMLNLPIVFQVTATNEFALVTMQTEPVLIEYAPENLDPPSIAGDPVVGGALMVNSGFWRAHPAPEFNFQWKHYFEDMAPTPIEGANAPLYIPTEDDVGRQLICTVIVSNSVDTVELDAGPTDAVTAAG